MIKQKKYTLSKARRVDGSGKKYWVWILGELSFPDSSGNYLRAKVVADFGNTLREENRINAILCKKSLEAVAEREELIRLAKMENKIT